MTARLLIVTQVVDRGDPVLGFFHDWITELAQHVASIEVICLREGAHGLPKNVRVHSLGKERGRPVFGPFAYSLRFLSLAWSLRHRYDVVFVHMNQEYVLLGGWFWRVAGKKITLWRNHAYGNIGTRVAVAFADRVYCTSPHSFTARFKKTRLMPAGIDTQLFAPRDSARVSNSLFTISRISRIKRIDVMVGAAKQLARDGVPFTLTIIGSPISPDDKAYERMLRADAQELVQKGLVVFAPSVSHTATAQLYASNDIFINMTPAGSFDKTILEALASGTLVLTANSFLKRILPNEFIAENASSLARAIRYAFSMPTTEKQQLRVRGAEYVKKEQSLIALGNMLDAEFKSL